MWGVRNTFVLVIIQVVLCRNNFNADGFMPDSGIVCPVQCRCFLLEDKTDCSFKNFTSLPNSISLEVKTLNLSHNSFEGIPNGLTKFEQLTELYLGHNSIFEVNNLVLNISSLQILDLSHNNINRWGDIQPNNIFEHTIFIKEFHISSNRIINIPEGILLKSHSLEILHLKNCSLRNISRSFLTEIINITHLDLSINLLRYFPPFWSKTLTYIDISRNGIENTPYDIFDQLPVLKHLILSHNKLRDFKYMKSNTLERLDISFCKLENIDLNRLHNLTYANIRENNIRFLTSKYFTNRKLLHLDLSVNSIRAIEATAFSELSSLVHLDLSVNLLHNLPASLFSNLKKLTILNLSKNYILTINFYSATLKHLYLSACEIQSLNEEILDNFPSLRKLDLSKNFLNKLPKQLNISTLEDLDLSMNKLTTITNETFSHLNHLIKLNLKGNRFTSGIKASYFPKSLTKIIIDDNLWFCNCFSDDFHQFYTYLTQPDSKIDKHKLICHSPENVTGRPWDLACNYVWSDKDSIGRRGKMWFYAVALVLIMSGLFCFAFCMKRIYAIKKLREQRERERLAEEARERIRRLRMQQRQTAQQNAPDPRELQRPPSYAEACLMPRIDGSTVSLAGSRHNVSSSHANLSGSRTNVSGSRANISSSSTNGSRRHERDKESSSQINNSRKSKKSRKQTSQATTSDPDPEMQNVQQFLTEDTDDTDTDQASSSRICPKGPVIESNL